MGKPPRSQEQMKYKTKKSANSAGERGHGGGKKSHPSRGVAKRESEQFSGKAAGKNVSKNNERPQRAAPRIHMALYGIHAVAAALTNPARTIRALYVTDATEDMAYEMVANANKLGFDHPAPILLEKPTFERALPREAVHQGIGLDCDPLPDVYLPDIINRAATQDRAAIVLLDQVTDPHNLGAIIRSACAFGAAGIVVQSRHAPELSALVAKTASGAMEHMPVVYETNLARAIENLQEHGYFALALDERGTMTLAEAPRYQKTVLVLGAEGAGLRPLIRDKCDVLVRLPTSGHFSSLNVSNAAAVALYAVNC